MHKVSKEKGRDLIERWLTAEEERRLLAASPGWLHTFATRLVHAGADICTVQKLGRGKTISMVMPYAHHHSESLCAGIEIFGSGAGMN